LAVEAGEAAVDVIDLLLVGARPFPACPFISTSGRADCRAFIAQQNIVGQVAVQMPQWTQARTRARRGTDLRIGNCSGVKAYFNQSAPDLKNTRGQTRLSPHIHAASAGRLGRIQAQRGRAFGAGTQQHGLALRGRRDSANARSHRRRRRQPDQTGRPNRPANVRIQFLGHTRPASEGAIITRHTSPGRSANVFTATDGGNMSPSMRVAASPNNPLRHAIFFFQGFACAFQLDQCRPCPLRF